ncbi:MAG: glutathione peroxidase [Candidatus Endobugula sp.]|jgi:glutathione peroxidase
MIRTAALLALLWLSSLTFAADRASQCPGELNHSFRKLHSNETVNMCDLYKGGPVLFVNTASHCGFTPQLKGLEALHQKYQSEGLVVVGFSSNDFNQAAKSEEKAAKICYYNFGVTFTMLSPTHVRGNKANPIFSYLAKASGKPPTWNFSKYLMVGDGSKVSYYLSSAKPLGSVLEMDVRALLSME